MNGRSPLPLQYYSRPGGVWRNVGPASMPPRVSLSAGHLFDLSRVIQAAVSRDQPSVFRPLGCFAFEFSPWGPGRRPVSHSALCYSSASADRCFETSRRSQWLAPTLFFGLCLLERLLSIAVCASCSAYRPAASSPPHFTAGSDSHGPLGCAPLSPCQRC